MFCDEIGLLVFRQRVRQEERIDIAQRYMAAMGARDCPCLRLNGKFFAELIQLEWTPTCRADTTTDAHFIALTFNYRKWNRHMFRAMG
jgi:hypothetical protein